MKRCARILATIALVGPLFADAGIPLMQMRLRSNETASEETWRHLFVTLAENPGCCDEIWFSTGIGTPSLAWHERHAAVLKKAAEDVRSIGVIPALQFQATIGHGGNWMAGERFAAKTWTGWTDWKGLETRTCNCPRQPAFLTYLKSVATIYAQVGFKSVWIDDDLRYNNHNPADNAERHLGCWCETCLRTFNEKTDATWTRRDLADAVRTNDVLFAQWRSFSIDSLCGIARSIAERVKSVAPQTMMALQQGSWPDAVDSVNAILTTLHETSGGSVGYRPGAGAYYDVDPNAQVCKSIQSCMFIARLSEGARFVSEWTTEIESAPRTYYSRSAQSALIEGFVGLMFGMNRMSYFLANSAKEDTELYARAYWKPFSKAAAALHCYANAVVGAHPVGVACGDSLALGLRRAGIPLLAGIGESRGSVNEEESVFEALVKTSREVQAVRDAIDERCGRLPAKLCSPFVGMMMPQVDAQGHLCAVVFVNMRIGAQEDVRVVLRGLPKNQRTVCWQELSASPVSIHVEWIDGEAFVTIPLIGAWNAGCLVCK